VHRDICGPSVSPIGESMHFLTFVDSFSKEDTGELHEEEVDNFSRKTWVNFTKKKFGVFSVFKIFKAYVERQTDMREVEGTKK
jgi:hypothetical protein